MFGIYTPAEWCNFFIMVGGGAAALAGLVFVAISINLKIITHDVVHKSRAISTLTGFASVFMVCAFALLGNQNYIAFGIEWLLVSVFATYVYFRGIVRAGKVPNWSRVILATPCYLGQVIGSILLIFGYGIGVYIASLSMVFLFATLISGSWLLIISFHND